LFHCPRAIDDFSIQVCRKEDGPPLATRCSYSAGLCGQVRAVCPSSLQVEHRCVFLTLGVTPRTPDTTHILIEHIHDSRRIHTDGRDWPEDMDANPMFAGYSIGKWIDEDGDGRYDVLVVETRGLKNPRTYDASGIPFHEDGRTIIKEKIYLDKADPSLLHDEITTIDNALTRPWTVVKNYRRVVTNKPIWWREDICAENNVHVVVGKEDYFLSADGFLMPIKKDQPPPDLRYFNRSRK